MLFQRRRLRTPPQTNGATTTPTSDAVRAQEWFFQNNLEKFAIDSKAKNHSNWKRNLKILRDSCYERQRNSDLSRLYDEWSKETTPYFDKQFAPKLHPSDSEEIKEIKRNQAASLLQHELNLMHQRSIEKSRKINEIDESMRHEINQKNDELMAKKITEMWDKELKENMKIAEDGWSKQKEFLIKKKQEAQNPQPANNQHPQCPQPAVNFTPNSARHRSSSNLRPHPSTPHPSRQRSRSGSSNRTGHRQSRSQSNSRNGRGQRRPQQQQKQQQQQRRRGNSRTSSRGRRQSHAMGNVQPSRRLSGGRLNQGNQQNPQRQHQQQPQQQQQNCSRSRSLSASRRQIPAPFLSRAPFHRGRRR